MINKNSLALPKSRQPKEQKLNQKLHASHA